MNSVFDLVRDLVARRSVTPEDADCQALLAARLAACGFHCEHLPFGEVSNLWARRGTQSPLLCFAGHTDVVPTGPLSSWTSDPFEPVVRDGKLFGRGTADMKSSIASFLVATERFVTERPAHSGSIAFLITSDEEGPSVDGTAKVVAHLAAAGEKIDYCIVGEPTSVTQLGDMIKNGRRGSLSGKLIIRGVQGHIAYPHLARNPIHHLAPALAELAATQWDEGNAYFPPTSWQCSNLHAGTGATNVIPGVAELDFNFRFATVSTPESLRSRLEAVLQNYGLAYSIDWTAPIPPFLTEPGALVGALEDAIRAETGSTPALSTTGGTSDGRFIARICPELVEFGPVNASIHKVDENIDLEALESLPRIYLDVLRRLLP